MNLSQFKPI